MTRFRKVLLIILGLLLLGAIWVWWNRPRKVDMSAYVPADSLIYLEANDLPDIISGIVSTDAWKALAPPAGIKSNLGYLGWLSRLVSWTGIGSADAVVLSRAQIAVTVTGLDAADAGETLKIKPRYAIVAETHTGESRTRTAVENRVGAFARRAYGDPLVETKEENGASFTIWISQDGERRIISAVMGSVAVIGNDESAVQACLAVRRSERPSLASHSQLEEMRGRVRGKEALAFGYVSPEGAGRLLEIVATAYAGQISQDPRAQSAAASMLPTIAKKILGAVGWSAQLSEGSIEDRYFISLQNGVAARLQTALAARPSISLTASELLPSDIYSLSQYSYNDPAEAWRGLNSAVASQLDTLGSILAARLFDAALKPYGIEEPNEFLRSIGPEVVTARLDDSGSGTVTIVQVKDERSLREFVKKRLGAKPRSETIGATEMLVSNDEKRQAASFVGGHLLLGPDAHVRLCLEAIAKGQTLATSDNFQSTTKLVSKTNPPNVITFTEEGASALGFIKAIAAQREARERPMNAAQLEEVLNGLRYVVSETKLIDGGFERRTRSSFGQFGSLASQFTPAEDSE
jgi:hypothetical protein